MIQNAYIEQLINLTICALAVQNQKAYNWEEKRVRLTQTGDKDLRVIGRGTQSCDPVPLSL